MQTRNKVFRARWCSKHTFKFSTKISEPLEGDIESLGPLKSLKNHLKQELSWVHLIQLKTIFKENQKPMARSELIARANYNRRRANYQQRRVRSGIKYVEGRIRNIDIKIGKIIPQSQNIEVKKNVQIVRRMTVRRKTIFSGNRPVEY